MDKVITVCVTLVTLCLIGASFYTCNKRDREIHELRRIQVEKCRSTPEETEKIYPYTDMRKE